MTKTPAVEARMRANSQEAALLIEVVTLLRAMREDLAAIRALSLGAPVSASQPIAVKSKRVRAPRKAKELPQ